MRAHARAVTIVGVFADLISNWFRSTPSCGGRPARDLDQWLDFKFRSTSSCGGRRRARRQTGRQQGVSIHALARRATPRHPSRWRRAAVSIHALARRATRRGPSRPGRDARFDPRPRTEGDAMCGRGTSDIERFRSTPSHGGLPPPRTGYGPNSHRFRSTPSHGGRPTVSPNRSIRYSRFDPRPRTEGDGAGIRPSRTASSFRSTPSHGGRRPGLFRLGAAGRFRSTPSHGGRPIFDRHRVELDPVSINAIARRATDVPDRPLIGETVSIHAIARRATC